MQQIKTIKAEVIIDSVFKKLHTYAENQELDEDLLYEKLEKLLGKFDLDLYPRECALLEIKNCKADLPEDFYRACQVLGCFKKQTCGSSRFEETWTIREEEVCEFNVCETVCDVCTDECGNLFRIIQKFNRLPKYEYNEFEVLCPTESSYGCLTPDSINRKSKSQNQIQITDTSLITEFDSGFVYMLFIKKLNGKEFLIPDQPTVREWLEAELIHETFQIMYYNGKTDILQRYQDSKRDLAIKQINALQILNRPEMDELYAVSNFLVNKYNCLNNFSYIPATKAYNNYYGYY